MSPPTLWLFAVIAVIMVACIVTPGQGFIIKTDETFLQNPYYQTQAEIEDMFARLAKIYPEYAKVETIGRSLDGRNLVVLQIGRHVHQRNLLTPMTKYIGNMHGDETVGRQLLVYLAQYLLYNYETDLEVAQLVNTTDIYLMPTMNPDGYERSQEGTCESLTNYIGRTNAAGVDLNRDFPDRLESQHTIQQRSQTRQPETAALIEWIVSKPFVLSANFHGGAIVASYPYDNSVAHHECCAESLTPDDRVFKLMAHTYADNHPVMRRGNNCNDSFNDGVTNGAHWYELNGGMQDFNYAFTNCFELTIELSCCKFPPADTLPAEWAQNKRSLLQLLKLAHIGVKGVVKDASGYPIKDATIVVSGIEDKPIRTTERGEYWRLLTPGLYNVQALAFGYQASAPQQIHVTNDNNEAQRLDFNLSPIETNYDGDFRKLKVERADNMTGQDNGGFFTPTKFEHHNFTEMERFIRNIADSYPSITRLYSIGKSVQLRDLWVMEIFAQPGAHVPGVPEFKYVANMHGNEVVGKELLLLLTKYLCEHYLVDERITRMVNTTRLHFLYSMNPDGYEVSHEGDKSSADGRGNAHNVDLNRNFPDQYGTDKYNRVTEPEVTAVMKWTLSLPFVLSANLHGGSLVANYPFDDNENDFNDPMTRLRLATVKGRKLNPTDDNALFQHLALVYSQAHPTMHLGNPCPLFKHELFPQGITNGAQWYSVTGGMQDWNYVHAGVLELTLELGCDKFPPAAELPKFWADNREPLLLFIEQVHYGAHGFVHSSIGSPVAGAAITVDGAKHATYSTAYGDYWKLMLPGRHNITVLGDSFMPQREEIEIPADATRAIRLDITMMHDDVQHWASAYDYRIIENVVNTRYHGNSELRQRLAEFETRNGQIATFGYAESEFGSHFNSIKLTADIGEPEESKYKILVLSSFFDTVSPLGREITMNLVRHILEGYHTREPPIVSLLQRSVIYFLPIMENFDEVFQIYNQNNSICDPVIGNELADRILSPEVEKRRDLLLQFLEHERFDLMLSFTTGNSDLRYPQGEQIIEKFARSITDTEFNFSPLKCEATPAHTLQHDYTERITNMLYTLYNTPLFSLGLSCCRMPVQKEIAAIWRKNLERIKNFLHLVDTGAVGQVQSAQGEPLRDAFIRLVDHKPVYNVSKNAARFQLILPAGTYGLQVSARNYETRTVHVDITHGHVSDLGVIKLSSYAIVSGQSEVRQLGAVSMPATISGFVLDTANHPVRNAKVSVQAPPHNLRNFTDSMGAYSIAGVPAGDVTLSVEAPRHLASTRLVHVGSTGAPIRGVVFRLKVDEHVFGLPRLVFLILSSILIIVAMALCFVCVTYLLQRRRRGDKRYYSFSLLPQKSKELFEDEVGEDGETELFRSPIKKGMAIQPYYDDDKLEQILDTDDEDAELDNEFNDDSGEEIIMLEKRAH